MNKNVLQVLILALVNYNKPAAHIAWHAPVIVSYQFKGQAYMKITSLLFKIFWKIFSLRNETKQTNCAFGNT